MTYDRDALRRELIRDEGLRLKPYRCTAGALTVGVGRNLDAVGLSRDELYALGRSLADVRRTGVSHDEAMLLLDNDITRCEAALDRLLPWWRGLSDARQRVLMNMCFNLGESRLLGFRNTLPAIRDGKYLTATAGMRKSLWARQVKGRADRLITMMREG